MVDKKTKWLALVIDYHDDLNSEDFLTEVIGHTLGYDPTQAGNCAHIIVTKGSYTVKKFRIADAEKANAFLKIFLQHDIPARLVNL